MRIQHQLVIRIQHPLPEPSLKSLPQSIRENYSYLTYTHCICISLPSHVPTAHKVSVTRYHGTNKSHRTKLSPISPFPIIQFSIKLKQRFFYRDSFQSTCEFNNIIRIKELPLLQITQGNLYTEKYQISESCAFLKLALLCQIKDNNHSFFILLLFLRF